MFGMAAEQHDMESDAQARAGRLEDVSTGHAQQSHEADVTCSEDGSRCLSLEERRAIGRRVIAERQRAFELLEMYDTL